MNFSNSQLKISIDPKISTTLEWFYVHPNKYLQKRSLLIEVGPRGIGAVALAVHPAGGRTQTGVVQLGGHVGRGAWSGRRRASAQAEGRGGGEAPAPHGAQRRQHARQHDAHHAQADRHGRGGCKCAFAASGSQPKPSPLPWRRPAASSVDGWSAAMAASGQAAAGFLGSGVLAPDATVGLWKAMRARSAPPGPSRDRGEEGLAVARISPGGSA